MTLQPSASPRPYRMLSARDLPDIGKRYGLGVELQESIELAAQVLPFRVNSYVLDELIDWDRAPDDPMFQLTFPQREMLDREDYTRLMRLRRRGVSSQELQAQIRAIQDGLNPHPGGQLELNVPRENGSTVEGIQHKYRQTVLFFPTAGQTCHAYCTYCFRWAQFVGIEDLKFAAKESAGLVEHLRRHPDASDVLVTGGDPMVMKSKVLRRYIEPLLKLDTVRSIRFGTKAPAYWPDRFLTDPDADDLFRLFDEIRAAGKHVALMAHYSHPREIETEAGEAALRRIVSSGTTVRCQAPVIAKVNDSADLWARMWQRQVELGAVPYYMFVERDTGPRGYFELSLARAYSIYHDAVSRVSGLARTVRGPSMSATPGKALVDGILRVAGEKVFALKFLQARDPSWTRQLFFAQYDDSATWLDDLEPAFGDSEFFYEEALRRLGAKKLRAVEAA